jgi:hypothetical protein
VTRSPWISAASQRTLVPTPVTTPAGTFEVPYRMRFLHPRESLALGLIEHQGKDSSLVLIKLVTKCQGRGFGHPGTFKPGRPTAAISSPIIRGDLQASRFVAAPFCWYAAHAWQKNRCQSRPHPLEARVVKSRVGGPGCPGGMAEGGEERATAPRC